MPYQWRLLAIAVLVLAGCGAPGPAPVGSVEDVLSPVVLINGSAAAAGDAIPGNATLSTSDSGVLDFLLRELRTSCRLRPDSQIIVEAAQRVTFRYQRGAVWCQSSATPDQEVVVDVGSQKIRMTDARFGLRDGQLVVDSGDVTVTSATSVQELRLVTEDQSCQLGTVPVVCASYAPDLAERAILDDVHSLFDEVYSPTSSAPPTSGEPSVAPETSTGPAEDTGAPSQETSEPTPEPAEPSAVPPN